jgi:enoyl-CoA hydratase/carnithine racemase
MGYEAVLVEKREQGHVGIVTLNRPDALNTFSAALARDLSQALIDLDEDKEVRVIVINGAGKCFSAGIDVSPSVFEAMTPYEYYDWITLMEKAIVTISKLKKPVIASVHGFAVANGIGIVAAADLAIAEEGVRFGATAINVGLNCIGPQVSLYRNIGKKKTLELVLRGNLILADEAERIGLINKVVPKGTLEEETMNLAKELAEKSPLALQSAKKSFYDMSDLEFTKAMELVNSQFAILCSLDDACEGIKAFSEKRAPEWQLK